MLSRGNSNAAARLRRAKSMSSTQVSKAPSEFKPSESETAHPHAIAAASHAYVRANTRASAASETSTIHDASAVGGTHEKLLRQKQSVRFTGPTASPGQQRPITIREAPAKDTVTLSPTYPELKFQPNEPIILIPESALTALPQPNPSPSNPSSYRKLKKAKSMFTPRKARSLNFSNGTQDSKSSQRQGNTPLSSKNKSNGHSRTQSHGPLFFRDTNTTHHIDEQEYDQDTAIQLARDEYLRQIEQQRLQKRPSFLRLRKHRSEKHFPKTVRTNRTNMYGNAIESNPSLAAESPRSFGSKARDISITLKNKLKRAFQRGGGSNESLPSQQINAQRLHFGDFASASSGIEQEELPVPVPDPEVLNRVKSRPSSPHRMPVHISRASSPVSIRSVSSRGNRSRTGSRVSSWTNSTAANTLTTQQLLESKRLSIIQENGGQHQPSLSIGRKTSVSRKGYGMFRKPLHFNGKENSSGSPVDSRRIFSALQKRFDEQNRIRQQGDQPQSNHADQHEGVQETSKDSTPIISAKTRKAKPSVRMVSDSIKNSSNIGRIMKHSQSANFGKPPPGDTDDVFQPSTVSSTRQKPVVEPADLLQGLTPQQIADRNELHDGERKRSLREVKSAFFPSTTHYEIRNNSPFRRFLHSSSKDRTTDDTELKPETALHTPRGNIPPFHIKDRVSSASRSESAYSRTTGRRTPLACNSHLSLAQSDSSGERGTVMIIPSSTSGPDHSVLPTTRRDPSSNSTQSSAEWKGWMASQVEALTVRDPGELKVPHTYTGKRIGHRREHAQIFGDDTDFDFLQSPNSAFKQPLASLAINALARPSLEHKLSDQMIEKFPLRFPLVERPLSQSYNLKDRQVSAAIEGYGTSFQKRLNQESKIRTSSQTNQGSSSPSKTLYASLRSRENYNPKAFVENINSSQSQLQDFREKNVNHVSLKSRSAANLQNRYSPERKERLRRMQSNLTQSSKENTSSPSLPRQHTGNQPGKQAVNSLLSKTGSGESLRFHDAGSFGPVTPDQLAAGSQQMVDVFLNTRRRNMQMSEERDSSPVFI